MFGLSLKRDLEKAQRELQIAMEHNNKLKIELSKISLENQELTETLSAANAEIKKLKARKSNTSIRSNY